MSVISNFIVILLFLNALRSNLAPEAKIRSLFIFIAQKVIFVIIYYKKDNLDSDFGHFLAKHVLKIELP